MTETLLSGVMYLTVRKDYRHPQRLKAVKVTSKHPEVLLEAGDRVIKLNLSMSAMAFRALEAGLHVENDNPRVTVHEA